MIRLLHTADLHLDASFPALGDQEPIRKADLLKTFERLLTLAIKSDVDLFLVAGDLFDRARPTAAAVGQVQAGLKRLADRGIVPVLLPGTHDSAAVADSVYRRHEFPGAVVLAEPQVDDPVRLEVRDQEVFLYGFGYHHFSSDNALAGMMRRHPDGIHLGLLHGSRQGSPEWDYRKKDLPFNLPLLRSWQLDYVALGHYHSFELFEDGGRVLGCYPGSPEGKRFGENGPRYCALVTVGHGRAEVEKVVVNGRVLEERTIDLSGCENEGRAVEAISALGEPDLLLRLSLTGIVEAPLNLESLTVRCRQNFFHLELVDCTRLFDSDFAQRIAAEETVRGLFVRRAREEMAAASEERRAVLEEAFRHVLVRFHAFGDGK